MEETEHKAVAYDVFMAATKDWTPFQRYFRRCLVMAIIGVLGLAHGACSVSASQSGAPESGAPECGASTSVTAQPFT